MNQVAFHLGEPIYWYLAQQQQIEALLETSHLQIEDADISATDRIHHLFEEAIARRGSDFHLEPVKISSVSDSGCDGYLQDFAPIPMSFHPPIFLRIKLFPGMDFAVRRRPQDGHYTYNSNSNRIFDVRVSTLPG